MPFKPALHLHCTIAAALLAFGANASAQDLVLGFLTAESGPFVSLARSNEIAARMALDEINSAGGINGHLLKLQTFDTAGSPAQAVSGLRKLAEDDKVLAVIGPFSSAQVQVTSALADRLGIVTMSMGSSAPKLVANTKYSFRNTSDEGYMFDRALRTIKAKRQGGPASAAVAFANDDAVSKVMGEKVIPSLLEGAGIKVTSSVDFKLTAFDLSTQVAQLKAAPTEFVAVSAPPEAAIKLAQELRRQGHNGRIIAPSLIADPDLPARMGKDGEATTVPTSFFSDLNDGTRKFTAEFAKRSRAANVSRTAPGQFDAATYDIVHFYAWAMRQSQVTGAPAKLESERTSIRDAIRKMNAYPALVGPVSFNTDNDAVKPVYVLQVQDMKWRLLEAHSAPKP